MFTVEVEKFDNQYRGKVVTTCEVQTYLIV